MSLITGSAEGGLTKVALLTIGCLRSDIVLVSVLSDSLLLMKEIFRLYISYFGY